MMSEVHEAELLDACRQGTVLDCGNGDTRRAVDAAALRRCCLELRDQIDPHGVRLRNAAILGALDLAGFDVPFPLRFDGCEFDSAPVLEGAQLYEIALTGCVRLPGLLANGLRVRRDLDLSRSHVTGGHRTNASTSKRSAIWLCESDIGGRLLCVDTAIRPDGERSLQADRMHVGGTVRLLHQFAAVGEVRLLGVRIDGSLDLTGASIESSDGPALDLGDAVIGGSLFLIDDTTGRCPVIHGRLDMGSAHISGQFLIRNAILQEAAGMMPTDSGYSRSRIGGTALSAPRLSVGAEVTMEGSCEVTGGLDLSMSDMSSLYIGNGCTLRAAGRTALNLTNAELRSGLTLDQGVAVHGAIRLAGAHIRGNLLLNGTILSEPDSAPWAPEIRSLIAAEGVTIDGDVALPQLQATGGALRFRSATLGGVVDAPGARLTNPDGYTLNLHQALVKGSVRLIDGFESVGLVVLNRSTIEGRLQCTGGSFTCPEKFARNEELHAIEAISATIRAGMDLGWAASPPGVDLTNATTTVLADDPATWPTRLNLSGFTYDRFERPAEAAPGKVWDHVARCAWLNRQIVFDSGPYEQAARVFRQHGYAKEAEEILMAQHRQARQNYRGRVLHRRALDAVHGASVGYGYRPGRVLWLLGILLILVIVSLELPPGQATLRATATGGSVYTTDGVLRAAHASPAPSADVNRRRSALASPAPDSCGDGQVRCFDPIFYAIDTVVPLVSLDQRSVWYPDSHVQYGSFMEWWLNIATLMGWLLSSIFVLALARLARSM